MLPTRSLLVARWDRPLTGLAANVGLGAVDPDPALSWARPDGWQCLAPQGWSWFNQLLPPVEAVEEEIGGQALGVGLGPDGTLQIAFRLEGARRLITFGGTSAALRAHGRDQMVRDWGERWRAAATDALWRWAMGASSSPVSFVGTWGVLWVPHRISEAVVLDLLDVVGLGPDPATPPWWATGVPGGRYAVRPRDLAMGLDEPPGADAAGDDLVLAFVDQGVGIYELRTATWVCEPRVEYAIVRDLLVDELRSRDWTTATGLGSERAAPPRPRPRPWGARSLLDAASSSGVHASRVTIDPGTFGPSAYDGWDGWYSSPGFLVRSQDSEGAAAALHRAGNRFLLVDEEGGELSETGREDTDLYTPNWVSGVTRYDVGVELVVDTKGDLPGPMGRTMLRILAEELDAGGSRRSSRHRSTSARSWGTGCRRRPHERRGMPLRARARARESSPPGWPVDRSARPTQAKMGG